MKMLQYVTVTLLLAAGIDLAFSEKCINSAWKYYNGACYYFGRGKMTYNEAKASCGALGLHVHLSSIHSAEEQNFLNTQYGTAKYWLGLEAKEGLWAWSDDTAFGYSNWVSTPSLTKCPIANFDANLGKWTTILCDRNNLADQGMLCKYYLAENCINSAWTYYNGACYYFGSGKMTYDEAKANCGAAVADARLVSIHDANEQDFLNTRYGPVKYWLGLEPTGSTWVWNDDAPFQYSNWASIPSTAKCPIVNYEVDLGKWTTILCSRSNIDGQGMMCKYYPTGPCFDKADPNGISMCAQLAYLCNNPLYYDLMTDQCSKTCNRC